MEVELKHEWVQKEENKDDETKIIMQERISRLQISNWYHFWMWDMRHGIGGRPGGDFDGWVQ